MGTDDSERLHLFLGDTYYPGGGIQDYRGSYETLDECLAVVKGGPCDWADVAVLRNGKLVALYELETRTVRV